jgi:hypothetical protein
MATAVDLKPIVEKYFELIRRMRNGDRSSIDELMALWADNGTFEFKGAPPVVGSFRGALAIRTLYENRLKASGMPVTLDTLDGGARDVGLGLVDTEVKNIRRSKSRVLAGWRTTIGTSEQHGFDMTGSHVFDFVRGKIKSLKVTISTKPVQSHLAALSFDRVAVANMGRLSLAAWPVV